jgi:hypothetical protein
MKATMNIMLRDSCGYNQSNAQKEMVFKKGYESDGSKKLLRNSLNSLLVIICVPPVPDPMDDEEYYYPWVYTTSKEGIVISGYYHGYASGELTANEFSQFVEWFKARVNEWVASKDLPLISVKDDKHCEYITKMAYEVELPG